MNWTTLVSAETLAAALGQPGLVLVDCRHALADAEATAALLPHLLRAHGVQRIGQLAMLPSVS